MKIRAVMALVPSLLIFVLLAASASSGSTASALIIHNSWSGIWGNAASLFPQSPGGSIMWIGANSPQTLQLMLNIHFSSYFGIPSIVWLTIVGLASASFACAGMSNQIAVPYSRWLAIQALSISPLFVIAVDSGRWLFLILTSSLVLALEGMLSKESTPFGDSLYVNRFSFCLLGIRDRMMSLRAWVIPSILLFWGIPGPQWSPIGAMLSSPIYQIWLLCRNLNILPSFAWLLHA